MIADAGLRLTELVPGLEFAAVSFGLVLIYPDMAIRPSQEKVRTQGKNNRLSTHFGLNTGTFRRSGKGEIQRAPKDYRIELAHRITDHGMNHFRLHQKDRRVRPIADRDFKMAAILGEIFQLDLGKWAGSGDAGDSYVVELVSLARVQQGGTNGRSPLAIGGTWWLFGALHVPGIHDLECFHRTPHVGFSCGFD